MEWVQGTKKEKEKEFDKNRKGRARKRERVERYFEDRKREDMEWVKGTKRDRESVVRIEQHILDTNAGKQLS